MVVNELPILQKQVIHLFFYTVTVVEFETQCLGFTKSKTQLLSIKFLIESYQETGLMLRLTNPHFFSSLGEYYFQFDCAKYFTISDLLSIRFMFVNIAKKVLKHLNSTWSQEFFTKKIREKNRLNN